MDKETKLLVQMKCKVLTIIQVLQSQKQQQFFSSPHQCQINPYLALIAQNNLIPQSNHNCFQLIQIQLSKSLSNPYVVNDLDEDCHASFSP
jgi:hypothetical protein